MEAAMDLQPGLRIGLAPRFHSDLPWPERLRLSGGLVADGPGWTPEPDWRPLTPAELALLCRIEGPAAWQEDYCLFRLPEHVRRLWWEGAAAEVLAGAAARPGYERLIRAVADFARFKAMPLPAACCFE